MKKIATLAVAALLASAGTYALAQALEKAREKTLEQP